MDKTIQRLRKLFGLSYRDFNTADDSGNRTGTKHHSRDELVARSQSPVVVSKDQAGIPGYTCYKVQHPQTKGDRIFFKHDTLNPFGSRSVGKYMSDVFNAYCSEMGVQCTVMMDPHDYKQIYAFKNLGDRLVKIEYNFELHFIEPKESLILKTHGGEIPKITLLNNGVDI